jgi:hypothetical protein
MIAYELGLRTCNCAQNYTQRKILQCLVRLIRLIKVLCVLNCSWSCFFIWTKMDKHMPVWGIDGTDSAKFICMPFLTCLEPCTLLSYESCVLISVISVSKGFKDKLLSKYGEPKYQNSLYGSRLITLYRPSRILFNVAAWN